MVSLEEARSHLRVEVEDDDANIQNAINDAESMVNKYIYPKTLNTLDEEDIPVARRAVLYALYQFYYNRTPNKTRDFHECLVWTLQPIRTLKV